eukprot:jgi/Ulvmu1/7756/UM039_0064.1
MRTLQPVHGAVLTVLLLMSATVARAAPGARAPRGKYGLPPDLVDDERDRFDGQEGRLPPGGKTEGRQLMTFSAADEPACPSLMNIIQLSGELLSLKDLIDRAPGVHSKLLDPKSRLTILAPTNQALAAGIPEVPEKVLGLHVIEGAFRDADFTNGQTVTTISGASLTVALSAGALAFSSTDGSPAATVARPPMTPPPVEGPPVEDPPVEEGPSNDPAVVDGPDSGTGGTPGGPDDAPADCGSLFGIIESTKELGKLAAAVVEAGLAAALEDAAAPLTVLAPTNLGLPLEELGPDVDLQEVLGLHVIEGAFKAADLSDGQTLPTLGGASLTVSLGDGTVSFAAGDGGSVGTVLTADLMSCAGVLHIIDAVLLPGASDTPMTDAPDSPVDTPPTDEPGPPTIEPPTDEPGIDVPIPVVMPPGPDGRPSPLLPPAAFPPVDVPPLTLPNAPRPPGPMLDRPPPVDTAPGPNGRPPPFLPPASFPPADVPPLTLPNTPRLPGPTLERPPPVDTAPGPDGRPPPFLPPASFPDLPSAPPKDGSFVTKEGSTTSKTVQSSSSDSPPVTDSDDEGRTSGLRGFGGHK